MLGMILTSWYIFKSHAKNKAPMNFWSSKKKKTTLNNRNACQKRGHLETNYTWQFMANHRIYQELVYRNEVLKTMVVYHLQTVSGKYGWKVNGTRLFGSFQRKLSGSNGTSEKVVPFFPNGMFQPEIRVPFVQSHLWYQIQAFAAVFR